METKRFGGKIHFRMQNIISAVPDISEGETFVRFVDGLKHNVRVEVWMCNCAGETIYYKCPYPNLLRIPAITRPKLFRHHSYYYYYCGFHRTPIRVADVFKDTGTIFLMMSFLEDSVVS